MPTTLRELGIEENINLKEIADSCGIVGSSYKKMTHEEIFEIFKEVMWKHYFFKFFQKSIDLKWALSITIKKYFFSSCFVHKLTVEVFICVFNSVYGFACSYAVAVILIADTVIAAL